MGLYETGEIEMLLKSFEDYVKKEDFVFYSGSFEKENMEWVKFSDGKERKIYKNGFYTNGELNKLFKTYMGGYMLGKISN